MGACCCCSSKSANSDRAPAYPYCPQNPEDRELSSISHGALSAGVLVDTNLDTSTPDTYRSPPPPLPYDVCMPCVQTLPSDVGVGGLKGDHTEVPDPQFGSGGLESSENCKVLDKTDSLSKTDYEYDSGKLMGDVKNPEMSCEEDVCPTCFEEYDTENPRMMTKCEHHFHLSCILEWMERSNTCPICDQIMVIDNTQMVTV